MPYTGAPSALETMEAKEWLSYLDSIAEIADKAIRFYRGDIPHFRPDGYNLHCAQLAPGLYRSFLLADKPMALWLKEHYVLGVSCPVPDRKERCADRGTVLVAYTCLWKCFVVLYYDLIVSPEPYLSSACPAKVIRFVDEFGVTKGEGGQFVIHPFYIGEDYKRNHPGKSKDDFHFVDSTGGAA